MFKRKLKNKGICKKISLLGIDINYSLDSGISFLGMNISIAKHKFTDRLWEGLNYCLKFQAKSVLNVSSGDGVHAIKFARIGANVACIDYQHPFMCETNMSVKNNFGENKDSWL